MTHSRSSTFRTGVVRAACVGAGLLLLAIVVGCASKSVVEGPLIPMPDSANCQVQLNVETDKQLYQMGESVIFTATLQVDGSCTWKARSSYIPRDYLPIIFRLDKDNGLVSMADANTHTANWLEAQGRNTTVTVDAQHPLRECFSLDEWVSTARVYADMYDLSKPGTYTIVFFRGGYTAPYGVPSNVVTFTRSP